MNDTELTEPEADRLRQLLHRAADSLDVTVPDHVELQPTRPRPGRGRWLAAAAVLVVAAVGAAWWLSGDGEDRIDTGPAEPTVTVAPRVLEESGIWRLPEGLEAYRVIGAQDGGSFDTSSVDTPGVLAVDDPEDPQRWLMVQAYDEIGEAPEGFRQVELSDEVSATLIPTEGSTWFQLSGLDGPDGTGRIVAGGSAFGIDEEELIGLLTEHLSSTDALTSASSPTAPMEAMLDDAGFSGDRLIWQGNGDGGPGSINQQLQVTLLEDDDTEVVIVLNRTNAPAWAHAVQLRTTAELVSLRSLDTPAGTISVRRRPDLGRNVLESTAEPEGQAVSILAVISGDGVIISAGPTYQTADPSNAEPLTEEQQLRIINSLRAMSEDEFRSRLAELGAEFIEADQAPLDGSVTTIEGTPGG
jgi:hypothetical protein